MPHTFVYSSNRNPILKTVCLATAPVITIETRFLGAAALVQAPSGVEIPKEHVQYQTLQAFEDAIEAGPTGMSEKKGDSMPKKDATCCRSWG
jgi:hypothetical protein